VAPAAPGRINRISRMAKSYLQEKKMAKIGIGIIGCGGRLRGLSKMVIDYSDQVEIVALADPNPASLAAAKQELNVQARTYATHEQLLADPGVQWVMIGSWNCFHREHTLAAFAAGKHVFCEKPLATSIDDCLAMRQSWRASDRQFVIGFTLRYSPHYQKIQQLVAGGAIGQLLSMEFNETLDFNHGGYIMGDWRRFTCNAGSHLLEKCCHDIDLANWIVGSRARRVAGFAGLDFFTPANAHRVGEIGCSADGKPAYSTWQGPVQVDPFQGERDIADNQVAIIEFENNVRATFHTNCNAAIPERRMYLLGTHGAIRADVLAGSIELKRIGFNTEVEKIDANASGGHGGGDSILAGNIANCMLGTDTAWTGLEDGLKSAVTCFAIDAATESGRVVELAADWAKVDAAASN